MCNKGGSPPVPNQASTAYQSATAPSAFVQPYYQGFLQNAQQLSGTPFNPAMYGNIAPMNPQQTVAGETLWNVGEGAVDRIAPVTNAANALAAYGSTMGTFDPAQVRNIESPYTEDVVNATQNWFNNQNRIQGNDLISQAIRTGNAFGGDRAGIAEAQLAGQQQLAQAPVIAGLRQAGYTQALDEYNRLKTMGLGGLQAGLGGQTAALQAPATAMQQLAMSLGWGGQLQQQQQRERDVAQQNAMMASAYPFQTANWYGSTLGGVGPLLGSFAQGYTTPPEPNALTQGLGIASSLVGLGTSLFGKRGGAVGRKVGGLVPILRARGGPLYPNVPPELLDMFHEAISRRQGPPGQVYWHGFGYGSTVPEPQSAAGQFLLQNPDATGVNTASNWQTPANTVVNNPYFAEGAPPAAPAEAGPPPAPPETRANGGAVVIPFVPRRQIGGLVPVMLQGGGLVRLPPRRQYGGGINLDVGGGDDDDDRKTTTSFSLDQLSIPSYKAPPEAGKWMEQRMRDTERQRKKQDDNPTAGAIDALTGVVTKAAPLMALMALKEGGKVRRYADGDSVDDEEGTDDTDTDTDTDTEDTTIPATAALRTGPGPAIGEPDLTGGYTVPPGVTPAAPAAPAGARDAYAQTGAGAPAYSRVGRQSTTVIPGLGPEPRTFAQRWAVNPFTAAGAAMLQSRSPYFGAGLGAGLTAAAGAVERGRKEELLDQKPQMLTDGETIRYRVGNKIIDTGLRSPQAARQQAIETRQEKLERIRQEGRLELERERQKKPARGGGQNKIVTDIDRLMKTELTSSADIKGGSPTISTDEAYRRAVIRYNALNPNAQLPVPPAPPADAAPAESVDTRSWWEKNAPTWLGGVEKPAATARKPAAPAATPAAPAEPAAPAPAAPAPPAPAAPAPAEAPQDLAGAIKSGKVTEQQAIAQARAAAKRDPSKIDMITERLRKAGIKNFGDLLSGTPAAPAQ
jgi:hypothetical protein